MKTNKIKIINKPINIDKVLNDIKQSKRAVKQAREEFAEALDLKQFSVNYKPKKKSKITKKVVLDAFMYTIACASISLILVILLIQWMSI